MDKISNNFIETALKLMNEIKEVPTTEVAGYIYGSKSKKQTLNQKKKKTNPLKLNEAMSIIEFYIELNNKISKIIESKKVKTQEEELTSVS